MRVKTIARRAGFIACLCLSGLFLPAVAEATPRIFYTDIESGPNTGGENNNGAYLSIFGKGFGDDLKRVKVYIGDGEVVRYMYLGRSYGRPDVQQLSVQLGPATSSGSIKVVVNGVISNTDHAFTVRPGKFYFVSLSGSDRKGRVNDVTRPFRTPNYVRELSGTFATGDFIVVRGGEYDLGDKANVGNYGSWLRANNAGKLDRPMTFMGYPGEVVTATISSFNSANLIGHYGPSGYWVFANIHVNITTSDPSHSIDFINIGEPQNGPCPNVKGGRFSYGRLVNIDATGGSGSAAIDINLSDHMKLLGISIHDAGPDIGAATIHPIYLAAEQSDTEVGWCSVERVPESRGVIQAHVDGFSGCYSYKSITNIKIHDNLIHDVTGQAILLGGGTGDIDIYNNVIYAAPFKKGAFPYPDVISLRGNGGHLNARLFNNIVYVNAAATDSGMILGIGSIGSSYFPQRVELRNNIFVLTDPKDIYLGAPDQSAAALARWIGSGALVSSNNIWYGSNAGLPSFAGASDFSADPLFVNVREADFRLRSESPAKGKGSSEVSPVVSHDYDMNPRGRVNGYDIGAFQN